MGAREREILCITDITIAQHGFDANLVTVPVQSWQTWGDQSLRVNKRHLAALDGLVLDGVISV
jgi:hypothetical protein